MAKKTKQPKPAEEPRQTHGEYLMGAIDEYVARVALATLYLHGGDTVAHMKMVPKLKQTRERLRAALDETFGEAVRTANPFVDD